jgi:L-ascorbate metabolism protein UlaG (beta-lactamase superfamily)
MSELGALGRGISSDLGWGPNLGRGKQMDPERAARAITLVRPRIAVPIHWGTYRPIHHGVLRLPAFLNDPAGGFVEAAAALAPGVEVAVLQPGESLELDAGRESAG